MVKQKIVPVVETGLLVALAVVLELLFSALPILKMPQGGHFTLALVPLCVIGYRRGWKYALAGGIIYGLINMLIDGFWGWGSVFFDYIFAFGAFFITGLFKKIGRKSIVWFIVGIVVAFFFRYLFASLSGVLFFAEGAAEYNMSAFYYSFIYYNLPYCAASCAGSIIVMIILRQTKVVYLKLNDNE